MDFKVIVRRVIWHAANNRGVLSAIAQDVRLDKKLLLPPDIAIASELGDNRPICLV